MCLQALLTASARPGWYLVPWQGWYLVPWQRRCCMAHLALDDLHLSSVRIPLQVQVRPQPLEHILVWS